MVLLRTMMTHQPNRRKIPVLRRNIVKKGKTKSATFQSRFKPCIEISGITIKMGNNIRVGEIENVVEKILNI